MNEELTGKTFGMWHIKRRDYEKKSRHKYWICDCVCGVERSVLEQNLINERSTSCGCQNKINKPENFIGKKFGRWKVISFSRQAKNYVTYWNCQCDCGTLRDVRSYDLIRGKNKSCGCFKDEVFNNRNVGNKFGVKHGYSYHCVYRVHHDMIQRCYNHKSNNYRYYGQKGIKICDEWLNHPEKFIEWSLSNGWQRGLSIDRINSDLDYCPENCQWITRAENASKAGFQKCKNKLLKSLTTLSQDPINCQS